ncbi:hypothetical protein ACFV6E_04000 [Streptomyces sp. NPDC059785]|uniref:hypothetical protein n=1 Tax=Streptomyces sp. NPDC059785 TaxID=3346945 RepID=UPI0036586B0E
MGFFDALTGTRRPADGVEPGSAEELRKALLGLNGPDVPYAVRYGAGDGGAHLVAEWRVAEPVWQGLFLDSRLTHTLRFRLRPVPQSHEVRVVQEYGEVTRVGSPPRLVVSGQYTRGQGRTVSRQWALGGGADGGPRATETFRFDTADLRDPLRDTVLASGWIWRGVAFGSL